MEEIISTSKIFTLFQDKKSDGDSLWGLVLELSTNTVTDAFTSQNNFVPIGVISFVDGIQNKMILYGYEGTKLHKIQVSIVKS